MNLKKQFGYPTKRGRLSAGFTLIELLVVVLIIGILSSVALPQYQKSVDRAKGAEALTAGKALADAENIYYLEAGKYDDAPFTGGSSSLSIDIPQLKNWDLGTGSGCSCFRSASCQGTSCAFLIKTDMVHTDVGSFVPAKLAYYLEDGKTICRCCLGEKCQNFFGVKDGEEF